MSSLDDLTDPRPDLDALEFDTLLGALRGLDGCDVQLDAIDNWAAQAASKIEARRAQHLELIKSFMVRFRKDTKQKSFSLADADRRGTWELASRKLSAKQSRDDDRLFNLLAEEGLIDHETHLRVTRKWGEIMKLIEWKKGEAYVKATGEVIDPEVLRKDEQEGINVKVSFKRSDERITEELPDAPPTEADDGSGLFS